MQMTAVGRDGLCRGNVFGRKKLYTVMIKVVTPILLTVLLLKSIGLITFI